jgi:hypothetical protein
MIQEYRASSQQLNAWQKGLDYLHRKRNRAEHGSPLHTKLTHKISSWQWAIDHKGQVSEKPPSHNRSGG